MPFPGRRPIKAARRNGVRCGGAVPGLRQHSLRRAATLAMALGIAALVMSASVGAQGSVLDPRGPRASRIADVWWIMFALGGAVFVVVMALLLLAMLRARRRTEPDSPATPVSTTPILIGVVITTLIVIGLVGLTFWSMRALAEPDQPAGITIEVNGLQYWWEVRYPDAGVVTANEIHIPVGEPVLLRLTAGDVIHSFWVPELADKRDLVPGRVNEFGIEADTPGVYRGQCAEYCGLQHALMQFRVIADPPETFAAWLDAQRQLAAAPPPNSLIAEGEQVFLGSACVYCHAVRGTAAASDFGPDLTHLASRETIAAGILDNNSGNLAAWILDPQTIKPGNAMPGVNLTGEQLEALLAYLASLR